MSGTTGTSSSTYPTIDDRRRRRLARHLDAYGDRVQYSVFEAHLTHRLLDNLLDDVRSVLDPEYDAFRVYTLCGACVPRMVRFGVGATDELPGDEIVFVV